MPPAFNSGQPPHRFEFAADAPLKLTLICKPSYGSTFASVIETPSARKSFRICVAVGPHP